MSYLSYAGGSRFLQLFGGVNMSFYDWYADLPNAFPEIWGDQTDVCERPTGTTANTSSRWAPT
jgi:nitrate reductase alpha subunit